jgi:DNA-binding IclR family transcriptional regulator
VADRVQDDAGKQASDGVQVIARTAAILSALADAPGGLTFSQLAARTDLPKTTVHRICRALERVGYVAVDPGSGRRELGPGLLRLAASARRDLRSIVEPHLETLSKQLNETVDLAVLDGGQVLFIAQHQAPQRVLMAIARVGVHFPAYSLASGKALLAQLPADELRRRLPPRLEPTLEGKAPSREALLRELTDVHASGLAYDREEIREGICAVAVAVVDVDGSAASISVPMPAARFYEDQDRVVAALLAVRDRIQRMLDGV